MDITEFRHKIFSQSGKIFPMVARILGNDSDAEDALQDIMIKLWNCRKQLGRHPNPTGFIFLTARNHCFDVLKRRKSRVDRRDRLHQIESSENGHEQFELLELISAIKTILKKKTVQQREILLLRDIDGLQYDEIASIMDLNVQHVRVILSRTRKYVQEQLKKNYLYE